MGKIYFLQEKLAKKHNNVNDILQCCKLKNAIPELVSTSIFVSV